MWTKLGKAALTALVVVIVAELTARAVMGRGQFAHSYDVARNPNFRRAWPAFTEPRSRGPNEKLVILISNSQGYAPDLEDADLCYAHLLEERLNENDPDNPVTVANWSIGGASGPEMLLLAARAVDHDPDLLMLVTHGNPFNSRRLQQPLSFYLSDADQLAYRQPVRQRLPDWFLRQHRVFDPATFLGAHSGLVQWRNTFMEHRHQRWQLAYPSPRHPSKPKKLFVARKVRPSGNRLLKTWVRTFQDGRPDTPVLMVSMPLCQPKWDPKTWPHLLAFGRRMQSLAEDSPGVTMVDAIDVIDHDLFVTHTHLSAQGHARFARYLLPHMADRLGLPPGQAVIRP